MQLYHMYFSFFLYCVYLIYIVLTAPQHPEINDQFETVTKEVEAKVNSTTATPVTESEIILPINGSENRRAELISVPETITRKICNLLSAPFVGFVAVPKVNSVLRNIGTCIVNGAMEIITYYFPAPLIPLIATAAGMVIPFEPVVMLRERMPVTSYRRAFRTALNSFLSTFDRYRLDDEDDDPYMTRRFNRRMMNNDLDETRKPQE